MSLPDAWVNRVFDKLALVYGHQFLSRWDGLDLTRVKADWAYELRRFQQNPAAIAHALDNLPADRPPTVLQFRDLCASHNPPAPAVPNNPAPANPERVAQEIGKLRAQAQPEAGDRRQWARDIVARHQAGDKVTPTVLRIAKDALAMAGPSIAATADEEAPWQ